MCSLLHKVVYSEVQGVQAPRNNLKRELISEIEYYPNIFWWRRRHLINTLAWRIIIITQY